MSSNRKMRNSIAAWTVAGISMEMATRFRLSKRITRRNGKKLSVRNMDRAIRIILMSRRKHMCLPEGLRFLVGLNQRCLVYYQEELQKFSFMEWWSMLWLRFLAALCMFEWDTCESERKEEENHFSFWNFKGSFLILLYFILYFICSLNNL